MGPGGGGAGGETCTSTKGTETALKLLALARRIDARKRGKAALLCSAPCVEVSQEYLKKAIAVIDARNNTL
jgi:hypothetical protein